MNNILSTQILSATLKVERLKVDWPTWKTILLISIFVVIFFATIVYVIMHLRLKTLKAKYKIHETNKQILSIQESNPNFANVITELQQKTNNTKAHSLFSAFVLNTFLVNKYTDITIIDDEDDYFANLLAVNCPEANISNIAKTTKYKHLNYIDSFKTINKLTMKSQLIVNLDYNLDPLNALNESLEHLKDNGICIFLYNKYCKKQLNSIFDRLETDNKLKYEKMKFKKIKIIIITNYKNKE
ncbi:BC85_0335 family putative methyltransferase [Mycoplasma phocoenae]|uniref:Methyltransferase n=1 Tax=Mycoplasma phocoenae TaxID=754517 RepID=A0A858U715_9MOLU|nr:hypothetical protein [Mycoplasma phocoenae]QJG67023.1 hypothetical protein HGG69_01670 [Mycoplasma phocoenae]